MKKNIIDESLYGQVVGWVVLHSMLLSPEIDLVLPQTLQDGTPHVSHLRRDIRPGKSACRMYYTQDGHTVLVVESINLMGR